MSQSYTEMSDVDFYDACRRHLNSRCQDITECFDLWNQLNQHHGKAKPTNFLVLKHVLEAVVTVCDNCELIGDEGEIATYKEIKNELNRRFPEHSESEVAS